MSIKNLASNLDDDLRPEYDISKLTGGVRGKYYARATAGTALVLLEPDVAEAFPSGEAVNNALRALLKIAKVHIGTSEAAGKPPNKALAADKGASTLHPGQAFACAPSRLKRSVRRQYDRSLDDECTVSHDLLDPRLKQGPRGRGIGASALGRSLG